MALRFAPARGAGSLSLRALTRGPAGAAATIAAGTGTALVAGATPTVTNSGSSSAATFNFGLPRGADAGIKWLYDSSTTMADPGSGDIRFNHATLSSVTAIAVSATGSGSDVSDYVATWDDSTNTTKGHLFIREEAGSTAAVFAVTAVTDNTDWLQLTVTYVSGSLTLTADDPLYVVPLLIGNKGSDGDVAGPGVSVDGEMALWDGITGATLKRATTTGILKAASGVVSAASAGTDYAAPGANTDITSVYLNNTGLKVKDTNASHGLIFKPGSDLTADKTLTVTTGDSDRTLTLGGNVTADQDLSTTASPQFAGVNVGAATDTTVTRVSAGVIAVEGVNILTTGTGVAQGKHTIWVPASAMTTRTTNGAAAGTAEMSTNKNMFKTLDFDTTTQEFAQFEVFFPKSWDLSTVTFQPVWSHAATTTNFGVVWGLAGVARSDDDAGDVAFGTAQTSTDTGGTTNDIYIGPESSAITIAGTPAAGDTVQFQLNRTVADGGDTMGIDARLHGIKLFYTINASTDA